METPGSVRTGDGDDSLLKNLRDFCRWKNNARNQHYNHDAHSLTTLVPRGHRGDDCCGTKHPKHRPNPSVYQSTQQEPERQQPRSAARHPKNPGRRGMRVRYPRKTQGFQEVSHSPSSSKACPVSPSEVSEHSDVGSAFGARSSVGVWDAKSQAAAAFLVQASQLRLSQQGSPTRNPDAYAPPSSAGATPTAYSAHRCCSLSADERNHSAAERHISHKTLKKQCNCRPSQAAALRSDSHPGNHPPGEEGKKRYGAYNSYEGPEVWSTRSNESAFRTGHLESSLPEYHACTPAAGVYRIGKPGGRLRGNCDSPVTLPSTSPQDYQNSERISSKQYLHRAVDKRRNCFLTKDTSDTEDIAVSSSITPKAPEVLLSRHGTCSTESHQRIPASCDSTSHIKIGTFSRLVSRRTDLDKLFPTGESTAGSYEKSILCAKRRSAFANSDSQHASASVPCSRNHVDQPLVRRLRSGKVATAKKDSRTRERYAQSSTADPFADRSADVGTKKAFPYRRIDCSDVGSETARHSPSVAREAERTSVTGRISQTICRELDRIIGPAASHNRDAPARARSFSSGKRVGRSTSSRLRRRRRDLLLPSPERGGPGGQASARSTELYETKGAPGTSDSHSVDASSSGAQPQGLKLCPVCPVLAWVAATTADRCCYCGSVPSISSKKRILGDSGKAAGDIVVVPVDNSNLKHQPANRSRSCGFLAKSTTEHREDTRRGTAEAGDVQEVRVECPERTLEVAWHPNGLKYCRQSAQRIREQLANQQELLLKRAQELQAQDPHLFADADLNFPLESAKHVRTRGLEANAAVSKKNSPEKRKFVPEWSVSTSRSTCQPSFQSRCARRCSKVHGCADSDEPTATVDGTARTPCLCNQRDVPEKYSGSRRDCGCDLLRRDAQLGDTSIAETPSTCPTSTSAGLARGWITQTGDQQLSRRHHQGTHGLPSVEQCSSPSVIATVACQEINQKHVVAARGRTSAAVQDNKLKSARLTNESNPEPLASKRVSSDAPVDDTSGAVGVNEFIGTFPALKSKEVKYAQSISDVAQRESASQLPPANGQDADDLVAAVLKHLVTVQQLATATAQGVSPSLPTVTTDANAVSLSPRTADISAASPSSITSSTGESGLQGNASGTMHTRCTTAAADKHTRQTHQQVVQTQKAHQTAKVSTACEYQCHRRKQVPGKAQGGGATIMKNAASSTTSRQQPCKVDASVISRERRTTKKKGLYASTCVPLRGRVSDQQSRMCPQRETPLTKSPSFIPGSSSFSASCGSWRPGSASSVVSSRSATLRSTNSSTTSAPSISGHSTRSRQSISTNKECVSDKGTLAGNHSENAIAAAAAAAIAASVASAAAAVARRSAEKLAKRRTDAGNSTSSSVMLSSSTCSSVASASSNHHAGPAPVYAHSGLRKSVPQSGTVSGSEAQEALPVAPRHEVIQASSNLSGREPTQVGCFHSVSLENGAEGAFSCYGGNASQVLSNTGGKHLFEQDSRDIRSSCLPLTKTTRALATPRSAEPSAPEQNLQVPSEDDTAKRSAQGVSRHSGSQHMCSRCEPNSPSNDTRERNACCRAAFFPSSRVQQSGDPQASPCDRNSSNPCPPADPSEEEEEGQVISTAPLHSAGVWTKDEEKSPRSCDDLRARAARVQKDATVVTCTAASALSRGSEHKQICTPVAICIPSTAGRPHPRTETSRIGLSGQATLGRHEIGVHSSPLRSLLHRRRSCSAKGGGVRRSADHKDAENVVRASSLKNKRIELASPKKLRERFMVPLAERSYSTNQSITDNVNPSSSDTISISSHKMSKSSSADNVDCADSSNKANERKEELHDMGTQPDYRCVGNRRVVMATGRQQCATEACDEATGVHRVRRGRASIQVDGYKDKKESGNLSVGETRQDLSELVTLQNLVHDTAFTLPTAARCVTPGRLRRDKYISYGTHAGSPAVTKRDVAADDADKGRLVMYNFRAEVLGTETAMTIKGKRMQPTCSPHFGLLPDCQESPFPSTPHGYMHRLVPAGNAYAGVREYKTESGNPSIRQQERETALVTAEGPMYTYGTDLLNRDVPSSDTCLESAQALRDHLPDYRFTSIEHRGNNQGHPPPSMTIYDEDGAVPCVLREREENGCLSKTQAGPEHDGFARGLSSSECGARMRPSLQTPRNTRRSGDRREIVGTTFRSFDDFAGRVAPPVEVYGEVHHCSKDADLPEKSARLRLREQILREFQEAQDRMKGQETQLQLLNERIKKQHSMLAACVPPLKADCKQWQHACPRLTML